MIVGYDSDGRIILSPSAWKRVLEATEILSLTCTCGGNIAHLKTEEARAYTGYPEYSCVDCKKEFKHET